MCANQCNVDVEHSLSFPQTTHPCSHLFNFCFKDEGVPNQLVASDNNEQFPYNRPDIEMSAIK